MEPEFSDDDSDLGMGSMSSIEEDLMGSSDFNYSNEGTGTFDFLTETRVPIKILLTRGGQ